MREFTPENMTKQERSALVYCESVAVDGAGLLEGIRMNEDDFRDLKLFEEHGFLTHGRIYSKLLGKSPSKKPYTHWVRLTDTGWALAHACRRYRAFQEKYGQTSFPYAAAVHEAAGYKVETNA